MEDRTSSFPTLKLLAETLVAKLTPMQESEAISVRRQLQEISNTLEQWADGMKPSDLERTTLVSHLVDLNKEANQLLGRNPPLHEADTLRPPPNSED